MNNISGIFGNTMGMLEKSLNYLWAKQGATSNNLANVDTPNYKAETVSFEEAFQSRLRAAARTGSNTQIRDVINNTSPVLSRSTAESARLDGNNVNADVETVELTRTALQYQYGLDSLNRDIARLRTAIKGQ